MSSCRKVLIFSHIFPPGIDGGSQIIFKLCKVLEKQGSQIRVFTSDAYSTDDFISPQDKRIDNKNDYEDRFDTYRLKTWRWPRRVIRKITGPIFLWLPIFKIIRWQPDIVISGAFPTTIPIYAWLVSKITGAELGLVPCTDHNFENFHRFPLIPILKRAEKIYALTKNEKEYYQQQFKINPAKIEVFNPPVEPNFFLDVKEKPNFPSHPLILFLGNHARHKRIQMLIKAYEKLATDHQHQDAKLVIAGKKTFYTPVIKKAINNLPDEIKNNIELIGEFNKPKEAELLDQASVLVNPSKYESLGLVFLEAWARKKPVIGANLEALQELIDNGQTGLLFEKNNLQDLINKTDQILTDQDLARKMGENGYNKVVGNYKL